MSLKAEGTTLMKKLSAVAAGSPSICNGASEGFKTVNSAAWK